MNDTTKSNSGENANKPNPYATPRLRAYGDVRSLTEGGSGAVMEGGAMTAMMKFP